jgi:DtxR family Mn-dependent transcriptional regulator
MRPAGNSEAVEMYLKSLAVLGGATRPVAATLLAQRLDLTPVAANEMLRRLVRDGLVAHEARHGFTLTRLGREAAQGVIRRERLWERFLVDRLDLDPVRATDWACLLEHATSPEVVDALDAYLGYPETCPQGQPIPRSAEAPFYRDGRPLADVEVGETVRIVAFDDESTEVLEYLRRGGLAVGSTVRVAFIGPHRSLLELDGPDGGIVVGRDVAATIQIAAVDEPPVAGAS